VFDFIHDPEIDDSVQTKKIKKILLTRPPRTRLYIAQAAAPHWSCPPMWFEETRGGPLFCENNKTTLAESDKGSA